MIVHEEDRFEMPIVQYRPGGKQYGRPICHIGYKQIGAMRAWLVNPMNLHRELHGSGAKAAR